MPRISLPTFAGYLVTNGPSKVTKVLEARRAQEGPDTYSQGDHYVHLRAPLREGFLAGGDPQPLLDVLPTLRDPKKIRSHEAVVDGLSRYFRSTDFEARSVGKRMWTHGDLSVSVNPTACLTIGGSPHVAYVHLKGDKLDARIAAPVLELIRLTHGDLGTPIIVEARTGKVHRPSRSARTRRGLSALLAAEADSFVTLWRGVAEVA
jgi:hypothetical protein